MSAKNFEFDGTGRALDPSQQKLFPSNLSKETFPHKVYPKKKKPQPQSPPRKPPPVQQQPAKPPQIPENQSLEDSLQDSKPPVQNTPSNPSKSSQVKQPTTEKQPLNKVPQSKEQQKPASKKPASASRPSNNKENQPKTSSNKQPEPSKQPRKSNQVEPQVKPSKNAQTRPSIQPKPETEKKHPQSKTIPEDSNQPSSNPSQMESEDFQMQDSYQSHICGKCVNFYQEDEQNKEPSLSESDLSDHCLEQKAYDQQEPSSSELSSDEEIERQLKKLNEEDDSGTDSDSNESDSSAEQPNSQQSLDDEQEENQDQPFITNCNQKPILEEDSLDQGSIKEETPQLQQKTSNNDPVVQEKLENQLSQPPKPQKEPLTLKNDQQMSELEKPPHLKEKESVKSANFPSTKQKSKPIDLTNFKLEQDIFPQKLPEEISQQTVEKLLQAQSDKARHSKDSKPKKKNKQSNLFIKKDRKPLKKSQINNYFKDFEDRFEEKTIKYFNDTSIIVQKLKKKQKPNKPEKVLSNSQKELLKELKYMRYLQALKKNQEEETKKNQEKEKIAKRLKELEEKQKKKLKNFKSSQQPTQIKPKALKKSQLSAESESSFDPPEAKDEESNLNIFEQHDFQDQRAIPFYEQPVPESLQKSEQQCIQDIFMLAELQDFAPSQEEVAKLNPPQSEQKENKEENEYRQQFEKYLTDRLFQITKIHDLQKEKGKLLLEQIANTQFQN